MPQRSKPMLMKGNEALAEGAIRAGCRFFAGYPITPQNEIPEYMARRMPEVGGAFVQAESELAAINMVYGAAGAGVRAMTSSSSPGISLKQEGISYLAGCELPAVIVNVVRGGPGLGGIQPSQSDYFQATRGGGHGDYRTPVLAPASVQEMYDFAGDAFDIADRYRNPVLILADGALGQMMEPVLLGKSEKLRNNSSKPWATTGMKGRSQNLINSIYLEPDELEAHNLRIQEKYRQVEEKEARYEMFLGDDADLFLVAYGTTARVCKDVTLKARAGGMKVGLIRPVTLWPFPAFVFNSLLGQNGPIREVGHCPPLFLTVEMSYGQMVEDVRLSVNGRSPVHFYGRAGGVVPSPREVLLKVQELYSELGRTGKE
jgi:2-oxoglutarate ferredoxin oxidoreductase subunit alpha